MAAIRRLPDGLVERIAAGEVVERPASVVKELVENALDAGAREVRIELAEGGIRRIQVADDGSGMVREDALLAFDRHATSKIASFEELLEVRTLGFRGEALSSIAAVARVEAATAPADGEGTRLVIEGGEVRATEPLARPRGTTIEVADLFYNVPARRKFLKTPATELRRAVEVVQGYALARPEVRFSVHHDRRQLLDVLATEGGREGAKRRIGQIFGEELVEHLVELSPGVEHSAAWGFVGDPTTTRGRRLFVFVNCRLLRDRALLGGFYRAVRDEWKSDRFPALFLFLDLPPEEVDVNVHPQKSEVRFRDGAAFGSMQRALRQALQAARGEEPAPLEAPERPPAAPFVWQGLGSTRPTPADAQKGEWEQVREGAPAGEDRVAEAVYREEGRPVRLTGRFGDERAFRVLGQYKASLIVLEGPDGLYIVDQHVAHERILYERFRRALAGAAVESQSLLQPALLELAPAEAVRLAELAPALDGCGFGVSVLSEGTIGLTAVPAVLTAKQSEALLQKLVDGGRAEAAAEMRDRLLDSLAASQACRAAVKIHEPMSMDKIEALLTELFQAEHPYTCPHGRPVVLKMGDQDLERRFGRS